jgi:hypothetical protein
VAGIVAPSLRALVRNLIDYAGMFPPASLAREDAIARYRRYHGNEHAWMLGRFVVSATQIDEMPEEPNGCFAVLSDADHPREAAIESKKIISTSKPTYCEVSLKQLDEVKKGGSFAKLRTGGVTPDAIPSVDSVASYIIGCAERRLPFKATAGLHHPVREIHRPTCGPDATSAMMHGFINVFVARLSPGTVSARYSRFWPKRTRLRFDLTKERIGASCRYPAMRLLKRVTALRIH